MAFTTSQSTVSELFQASFGRAVSSLSALDAWVVRFDAKDAATAEQDILAEMNLSAESSTIYSGNTDAETVDYIFTNSLGRTAEEPGRQAWIDRAATIDLDQLQQEILAAARGNDDSTFLDEQISAAEVSLSPDATFELTADADPIVGTSGNDLITGAAGTLNGTDLISDASDTDNDTLNVTLDEDAVQPTISGIENINVELDVFDGADASLDATNITGATITVGSSKLGFNGFADVLIAGDNNVTAGTNVEDLEVTGLQAGVVDAGSADTVAVTTKAAIDIANVTVNGDVEVTVTTATDVALIGAAASTVTFIEGAAQVTEMTVTGDVTLSLDAGDADGDTVTGATSVELTASAASAFDFTGLGATITLDDNFGGSTSADFADAASVTLGEAQTGTLVFAGDATNDTNTLTVNTAFDVTSIDVQDNGLTTTIAVTDAVTVSTLVATGEDVVLTGSSDVEVGTSDAAEFDATAFTGDLEYTTTVGAAIVGGTGANTIVTADADSGYTGQDGVDAVDASALSSNTLAVVLGGGADTLTLDGANLTTATVAATFGAGTDTLILVDGTDTSNATLTLSGLENILIEENNGSDVSATISASTLTGTSYTIEAEDTNTSGDVGDLTVDVATTDLTIDLSSLTLTNVTTTTIDASSNAASTTITGTTAVDTITGSGNGDTINAGAGDDLITVGLGASTVTGGTGADTFTFVADDSTEAAMASITDFSIADFDELDLDTAVVAGDLSVADVDVSGADEDGLATDIDANVTSGIVTLSGADAGDIDTLAEWIDVIETSGVVVVNDGVDDDAVGVVAFEFDGNTYVYETIDASDDNSADVTTANIIELTGVTGVAALGTTPASDTLVIA